MRIYNFDSFLTRTNEAFEDTLYSGIRNWYRGVYGHDKRKKTIPESLFLYLKKLGYLRRGEIYRTVVIHPFVITIQQDSEYYDLFRFLADRWESVELTDAELVMVRREREVLARLAPDFRIISAKNYVKGDEDVDLSTVDVGNLKNKITKDDRGKLLSCTDELAFSEWFAQGYFLKEWIAEFEQYYVGRRSLSKADESEELDRKWAEMEQAHNKLRKENNDRIDKVLSVPPYSEDFKAS
jgi:hypothetical protein